MTTYTKDQILAIGGNAWTPRTGQERVYLNNWHELIGLEVSRYNTGNICSATINGQRISNGKATRLLDAKVWWQNGKILVTANTDLANTWMSELADGIATAVAAADERAISTTDATAAEATSDAIIEIPSRRPGRDPRYSYTCPKCGKTGIDVAYRVDAEKAFAEHLTTCAGPATPADDQPQSTPEAPADPAMLIGALRSAGRTVREIAAAVGVHASTVYRWARGLFRPTAPRLTILASI
jgi:transposase-like protein